MGMMSITFASRNLWRHRRRTLITAMSVAFGVWLCVVFVGTRQSTYDRLVAAGTKAGYGHVMIARRGYLETPSAAIRFAFEGPLKDLAADSEAIRSAVPRILSNAVVMTSGKNTGAALLGIDAAKENGDNNLFLQGLTVGKPWAAEDELGCLVGAAMAEHLKLEPGSKIVYTTTDLNGQMVSHLSYVRGIFRTGSFEFDGHLVLLPLAALQ